MYEDIPFIEEYKCNIGLQYCYINVLNVTYPLSYVTLLSWDVNLAGFLGNPSVELRVKNYRDASIPLACCFNVI